MMPALPFGSAGDVVAISPPSDIVLGVALAADPEQYRLAAERMRQLAGARAVQPADAAAAFAEAAPARPRAASALPAASASVQPARTAKSAGDAFSQLEAFVLQSFIQSMLPSNAEQVFGKGMAGDVWKSMLAEKLANELARSGQVGLAKRLAAAPSGVLPAAPAALASVLPYLASDAASVTNQS